MVKTKEELSALKNECESLVGKLKELSDDELSNVVGGNNNDEAFAKWAESYRAELLKENLTPAQLTFVKNATASQLLAISLYAAYSNNISGINIVMNK